MSKIVKDQRGFGGLETLLVVIIVILLGVVGFMVYNSHHKTNQNSASSSANKTAARTTEKTSASDKQVITSYETCAKTKGTNIDTNVYPATCTTMDNVVYRPTDPSNFPQGQQQITIPNNPHVTADAKAAEQSGYCFTSQVPGPQATATLSKAVGTYALVKVSPNCGDSVELTYSKTGSAWAVVNTSHLGLCFNSQANTSATLQDAIAKLCN